MAMTSDDDSISFTSFNNEMTGDTDLGLPPLCAGAKHSSVEITFSVREQAPHESMTVAYPLQSEQFNSLSDGCLRDHEVEWDALRTLLSLKQQVSRNVLLRDLPLVASSNSTPRDLKKVYNAPSKVSSSRNEAPEPLSPKRLLTKNILTYKEKQVSGGHPKLSNHYRNCDLPQLSQQQYSQLSEQSVNDLSKRPVSQQLSKRPISRLLQRPVSQPVSEQPISQLSHRSVSQPLSQQSISQLSQPPVPEQLSHQPDGLLMNTIATPPTGSIDINSMYNYSLNLLKVVVTSIN